MRQKMGGCGSWLPAWKRAIAASIQRGSGEEDLVVLPPATEKEVRRVEKELGHKLPEELRALVLEESRAVNVGWRLPDGEDPPAAFREISGGEVQWSLDDLLELNESRKDSDFSTWDQKLAFIAVGNGDFLALDLAKAGHPVVYLEHEEDSEEGRCLAPSLFVFLERWSALGCPGPEIWSLQPFLGSDGLEPNGENGRRWREWLGIDRASGDAIVVHSELREPLPEEQAARLLKAVPLKPDRETEAWNLARMCLERGHPDLTLRLLESLQTPSLRAEAPLLRIPALARAGRADEALAEAHRSVAEWLAPPTSQHSINQAVSKRRLLAVLAGVVGTEDLQAKVAAAPEPEMFTPDGDFM